MALKEQEDSSGATTPPEINAAWFQSTAEKLARTSLGQIILGQLDRLLWIVEKSAEWSLHSDELCTDDDDSGKPTTKTELVRPLPWVFFLPSLAILRSLRMSLNVASFIFGLPPVEPITMVKFMQKSRKCIKTLKNSPGESPSRKRLKHKDKRLSMNEAKKALIRSIRLTLSTLSCLDGSKPSPSPPPTKIHISALDLDVTTPEEKSATESTGSPQHTIKQQHKEETSSDSSGDSSDSADETLQEKIDRLALMNSSDDLDFTPPDSSDNNDTNEDNDDDNEDDDNEDDDDEDELHVSQDELQDIITDAKSLLNKKTAKQEQKTEQEKPTQVNDVCNDKAECDLNSQSANSKEAPTNMNQDGDTLFYSPISSTSSSSHTPERSTSPIAKQNSHSTETNDFVNGETYLASESTMSAAKPVDRRQKDGKKVVKKMAAGYDDCYDSSWHLIPPDYVNEEDYRRRRHRD